MSKIGMTTRDLFLRLGATSQSRSARADAVFRRLRLEKQDKILGALSRTPRRLDASVLSNDAKEADGKAPTRKTHKIVP